MGVTKKNFQNLPSFPFPFLQVSPLSFQEKESVFQETSGDTISLRTKTCHKGGAYLQKRGGVLRGWSVGQQCNSHDLGKLLNVFDAFSPPHHLKAHHACPSHFRDAGRINETVYTKPQALLKKTIVEILGLLARGIVMMMHFRTFFTCVIKINSGSMKREKPTARLAPFCSEAVLLCAPRTIILHIPLTPMSSLKGREMGWGQ